MSSSQQELVMTEPLTENGVLPAIRIKYVDKTGKIYNLEANEGDTLMTVATSNLVPGIGGDCGGNCACGTCLIRLDPRFLNNLIAPAATERELLDFLGASERDHRLGCQITLNRDMDGATVTVAEAS
jgi:ferredoxin, 2Fe-2S